MAKRILIVGNSDGIGAATTAALVARGESVVGVSRSPSSLRPPAHGDESHRHEVMDVTDPAYPALLGRLVQETGSFDACIYCVGVGSEIELSDLSHEARVFEVNLTAMVRTLEILLPPLARTQGRSLHRALKHGGHPGQPRRAFVFGLQSRIQQLPSRYGAPAAAAWDRGHQCPLRVRRHQNGQSGQEAVDHDRRPGGGTPLGLPRDTPNPAQPSQRRRRRRLVRTLAPDRTCLVVLTVSGRFDGPEATLPAFSAFLSRRGPGGSFQVVSGEAERRRGNGEAVDGRAWAHGLDARVRRGQETPWRLSLPTPRDLDQPHPCPGGKQGADPGHRAARDRTRDRGTRGWPWTAVEGSSTANRGMSGIPPPPSARDPNPGSRPV